MFACPSGRGVDGGGGGEDGGQSPCECFEHAGGEDALAWQSHVQAVGYFDASCACGHDGDGERGDGGDGGDGEHDAGGSLPVAGVEGGVGAEHGVSLFGLGDRDGAAYSDDCYLTSYHAQVWFC